MMKNRWNPDASLMLWHAALQDGGSLLFTLTYREGDKWEGFAMLGWFRVL